LSVLAVAVLAPLLPILLVGLGVWLVVRATRANRPRAAVQVI
jgi:hypothetical protein